METSQPVLLRPSRVKWLAVALGSLAFVAGSVRLVGSGAWVAWPGIAFFGLGVLVSGTQLLPGASYLRLTPEGFTIRSLFFRTDTIRWSDVSGFTAGRVFFNRMVMFNFGNNYQGSYGRSRRLRALNLKVCGFEAGIPDSYGMKHDDLAALMNRYKASAQPA